MNNWIEFIVNSQPIKFIYGDCTPSLNNVEVHSILFNRDGPTVSIKLNLKENEFEINVESSFVDLDSISAYLK